MLYLHRYVYLYLYLCLYIFICTYMLELRGQSSSSVVKHGRTTRQVALETCIPLAFLMMPAVI